MRRTDYVLAVLSAAGPERLLPVHLQKLFFLLDKKLGKRLGGPYFDFQPYHFGPFDSAVYSEVETLASRGLAEIAAESTFSIRRYGLTNDGRVAGEKILAGARRSDAAAVTYIHDLTAWVISQPFAALVAGVYQEYPEMRRNSIFRERR